MDLNEMKVGDFLKMVEVFRPKQAEKRDLGLQIVVLDRGFVYVGHVTLDNGECLIRDAKNIRVWGTMKGLGELVSGPTNKTVLDAVGIVRCAEKSIMHYIECEEKGWTKGF